MLPSPLLHTAGRYASPFYVSSIIEICSSSLCFHPGCHLPSCFPSSPLACHRLSCFSPPPACHRSPSSPHPLGLGFLPVHHWLLCFLPPMHHRLSCFSPFYALHCHAPWAWVSSLLTTDHRDPLKFGIPPCILLATKIPHLTHLLPLVFIPAWHQPYRAQVGVLYYLAKAYWWTLILEWNILEMIGDPTMQLSPSPVGG